MYSEKAARRLWKAGATCAAFEAGKHSRSAALRMENGKK
jgi:hypothetical protein